MTYERHVVDDEEVEDFIRFRGSCTFHGSTDPIYPNASKWQPAKLKAWLQRRWDEEQGAFSFTPSEVDRECL